MTPTPAAPGRNGGGLRLIAYRPLFSGAAVDRTPELQFQRPGDEVQIAPADAKELGVRNGATVGASLYPGHPVRPSSHAHRRDLGLG